MISEFTDLDTVPKEKLLSKLEEIAALISNHYKKEPTVGGLSGMAGLATFMFYYAQFTNEDTWAMEGEKIVLHSMEQALKEPLVLTYCSGLAGLGWTLEHLKQKQFIEIDIDELFSEVDPILFQKMMADLEQRYFDVLHGGLGYFKYFLSRYKNTTSHSLRNMYLDYLSKGLDTLERIAVKENDYIYWLSQLPPERKEWIINTGLSHGMASILSVLCDVHQIPELRERATDLMRRGINYLLHIMNDTETAHSVLPSWVDPEKEVPTSQGRTAWCYGDLGIALVFLKLADIKTFDFLKNEALVLLNKNILLNRENRSGVVDTGFCHGAFGNAHCYGIAFYKTGIATYREQQLFWMHKGFKMEQPDLDYSGFPMFVGEEPQWDPRLSLLEGIAGIGLVIIDYLNEERGTWDKALLL